MEKMKASERTLAFYDENAVQYALQTEQADLSQLYASFLPLLPAGGKILDLGCGGGRDLRAFKAAGFNCIGVDSSKRLSQLAADSSGCEVIVGRAQDLSFVEEFDGIWACASLLHLDRSELLPTLARIQKALKGDGVLFLSMQEGRGNSVALDGRFYAWYSAHELKAIVISAGLDVINQWSTLDTIPGREARSWINLLAIKKI